MQASLGDHVHFRSICAACQELTPSHYFFTINDPELLASLPEFPERVRLTGDIYGYCDYNFSYTARHKSFLKGNFDAFKRLFGRGDTYGFRDTYLIILTSFGEFVSGPDRRITALPVEQVSDTRILKIVNSTGIEHFNYLDLTTNPTNLDKLIEHLR